MTCLSDDGVSKFVPQMGIIVLSEDLKQAYADSRHVDYYHHPQKTCVVDAVAAVTDLFETL